MSIREIRRANPPPLLEETGSNHPRLLRLIVNYINIVRTAVNCREKNKGKGRRVGKLRGTRNEEEEYGCCASFCAPRGHRLVFAPIDELHDSIKDSSSSSHGKRLSSSLLHVALPSIRFPSPLDNDDQKRRRWRRWTWTFRDRSPAICTGFHGHEVLSFS